MIKGEQNEKVLFCAKIFLLIIEIIIVGIIAFIFFGVSKVNAATTTKTITDIESVNSSGTPTSWGNSSNSHTLSGQTQRIGYIWGYVDAGYYEGHITLELTYPGRYDINKSDIGVQCRGSSTALTCASSISWEKSVSSIISTYKISIWFNGNLTQQEWFQVRVLFPTNNYLPSGTSFKGTGSIDWTESDAATNTTINNAVTQIIQNAVENTTTVSQQIIQSNTDLSNAIANIMNNATTSIQNSLMHCDFQEEQTYNEYIQKNMYGSTMNNRLVLTPNYEVTTGERYKIKTNINTTTYQWSYSILSQDWPANNNTLLYDAGWIRTNEKIFESNYTGKMNFIISKQDGSNLTASELQNINFKVSVYKCSNSTDAIIENQNQNTSDIISALNSNGTQFTDELDRLFSEQEEEMEQQTGLLQSILSAIGGIFSSSIDDPSNTLNSFNNSLASNGTITSLLLLPVTIYQKVINSINATCVDITLGTLWNTTLTMPCLHIDGIIGNALYGTIDVIISGFFILAIRKRFISIFNNLSSLKTGGNELE